MFENIKDLAIYAAEKTDRCSFFITEAKKLGYSVSSYDFTHEILKDGELVATLKDGRISKYPVSITIEADSDNPIFYKCFIENFEDESSEDDGITDERFFYD